MSRGRAATTIARERGRRVVDVKDELRPGVPSSRPVSEDLSAHVLPELEKKYPGLHTRFAGEAETRNESLASLGRNFVLALFIMYALLAIPFGSYTQPAIVMSAIPSRFVGAIGGHLLHGCGLSIIGVMGILAYGVAHGTVIALLVVPALYLLVEDAGDAVSWVGRRLRR